MKRFSCIIFDLDGTLASTNKLIFDSFNHVAGKYAGKVFTPQEITAMFGPPEERALLNVVSEDRLEEAMTELLDYYDRNHSDTAGAYEGITETLSFLKENGVILALFTGKGRSTTMITLRHLGLSSSFDLIVTGNDVGRHKPSAEGIVKVMSFFSLRTEDVLMVGDSPSDVIAAREAGIAVATVLWDSYAKEKVLQMNTDYRFHSVPEFSRWIRTQYGSVSRKMTV